MSGLIFTIENMIEPVILCYLSFSLEITSPLVLGWRSVVCFIKVLVGLALLRWNLLRILLI